VEVGCFVLDRPPHRSTSTLSHQQPRW
jgi:hypothetical protein